MKQFITEFLRRGVIACGIGPLVLAALYLILQSADAVDVLTVNQVCTGIVSLTALAFAAGGMNAVYQIERLPLMAAILIHGGVLYFGYLITYLLNDWLEWGSRPLLVFSVIFVLGYLVIWTVIYTVTRRHTERLNRQFSKQHQMTNDN